MTQRVFDYLCSVVQQGGVITLLSQKLVRNSSLRGFQLHRPTGQQDQLESNKLEFPNEQMQLTALLIHITYFL